MPTQRAFGRTSAAFDVRAADEVASGGASFVTVVQAADFPECDHLTLGGGGAIGDANARKASGRTTTRALRQRRVEADFMAVVAALEQSETLVEIARRRGHPHDKGLVRTDDNA